MEKVLRSFIHEHFPLELRVQMELIGRRRDIRNEEKQEEIIKLLQSNNVDNFVKLGPGTNRYAFKLDGFVIKIATDHDGKIDNLKEFKMAKRLFPYVAKTYEVSTNGSILIAEYIQPFSSYAEMLKYADKIRNILNKLSSVYLIGDVGISSNNYANWGLRVGQEEPVCLDFAYVYDVSSDIFVCRECKSDPGILIPDKDYNILYCTKCNCKKKFEDIRGMIGNDIHRHEIGDLSEEGYELDHSYVLTTLDEERSNYLSIVSRNKKRKHIRQIPDDDIKEENEMNNIIKTVAAEIVENNHRVGRGLTIAPQAVVSMDEFMAETSSNNEDDLVKSEAAVVEVDPSSVIVVETEKKSAVVFSGTNDQLAVSNENDYKQFNESLMKDIEKDIDNIFSQEDDENLTNIRVLRNRIGNGHAVISRLSNKIAWDIRCSNLFDELKPYIRNKKLLPKAFYDAIQASIWKSLGMYIGCLETRNVPNRDNNGTHTELSIPDDNYLENEATEEEKAALIFAVRMYLNEEIDELSHIEDCPSDKCIKLYHDIYDDYLGLPHDWLDGFEQRLTYKIQISHAGVRIIANFLINHGWVVGDTNDFDGDSESENLNEDAIEEKEDEIEEANGYNEQDDQIEDDLESLVGSYPVGESNEEDLEETLEDIENEIEASFEDDMNDQTVYVSVDIIYGDKFDTIKLSFNDNIGYVSIPFYTKLDEITITEADLSSPVDDRNAQWDWLRHIMPDLKFTTKDPDKWIDGNDPSNYSEDDEYETHFAILSKYANGEYLIGAYFVNGIFGMYGSDENASPEYISDPEIYAKINKIVRAALENGPISHYARSLADTSNINTEEYILGLVVEEEVSEDEGGINEEMVDESEVLTDENDLSEQEKAAMEMMSGGGEEINDHQDDIPEPEEDTDESGSNDNDTIEGYLVSEKKNKSVIRTFYYDSDHLEKIEGEKGMKYVDISDGASSKITYRWNGRNYVPNERINNFGNNKQSTTNTEDTSVPVENEEKMNKNTAYGSMGADEDEIPVVRRKKK